MQELHLVELGDAVDESRDLTAEPTLQLGQRDGAVFGNVVEQGRDDGRGVHVDARQRLGDGQRMIDVRLARFPQLGRVCLGGECVGTPNRLDVRRRQVLADVVEERLWAARSSRSGCHARVGSRVYN